MHVPRFWGKVPFHIFLECTLQYAQAVSNDVTIVYVVFDLITYFSMKSVRLAKTNFLYCQTQRYVFDVETPKSIFLTVHYPIEVKCKAWLLLLFLLHTVLPSIHLFLCASIILVTTGSFIEMYCWKWMHPLDVKNASV